MNAGNDLIKRNFQYRYILALTLVAFLSICSYVMLRRVIQSSQSSAAIINFAGKRRFLSQKAGFHSLNLLHAKNNAERLRARDLLLTTVTALEQAHEGLIYGNKELGLPGNPSPNMKNFYFGSNALDATVKNYIHLCRQWAAAPVGELTPESPILTRIVTVGPNELLAGLDEAVSLYQGESEKQIATLELVETLVLAFTLLLLLLEALLIFRPMAEQVRAAIEKIEVTGNFLEKIINSIPDPILVKDTNHKWILVNDTFCNFVGKPREDLLGKTDYDVFTKETADHCREQDAIVFRENRIVESSEVLRDHTGQDRTVLIKKTMITEPSGRQVLIGAIRDITALKAAETELEAAKKDVVQSFKMASIGEMSAGIVHEINSPLTVIGLKARLIKRQVEAGDLQPKSLIDGVMKIEAMIENVGKIINSLKAISRDDSNIEMELCSLKSIVDSVLELSRLKLRSANVDLVIDPSVETLSFMCHPSEICQVLLNLVSNSIDAVQKLPERWVKIAAAQGINGFDISVTDSGHGIDKALQEKILQPFFSTKPVGSGVGLGLSIAVKLTQKHHGRLYIDQDSPHTRFVLHLPPMHAVGSTGS